MDMHKLIDIAHFSPKPIFSDTVIAEQTSWQGHVLSISGIQKITSFPSFLFASLASPFISLCLEN